MRAQMTAGGGLEYLGSPTWVQAQVVSCAQSSPVGQGTLALLR